MNISGFIKRYQVLIYFILVFVISWGGILLIVGPGGLPTTAERLESLGMAVYMAMLAGPGLAGILLTGLVHGRKGFRELFSRLFKWRVGARWYAIALLMAPLLITAILLVLSLFSTEFFLRVFASDGKTQILLTGILMGLLVGIFEEIGWTGFATPQLRKHFNILTTGLIVGILWGAWHFLLFWEKGSFSGTLPLVILLGRLFFWLPAVRVLIVWVYDHTGSILLAILMHASVLASQFILTPLVMSETSMLTFIVGWALVLWLVLATTNWQIKGSPDLNKIVF
jgi:membrane protease YdiL (CAAX protease family)